MAPKHLQIEYRGHVVHKLCKSTDAACKLHSNLYDCFLNNARCHSLFYIYQMALLSLKFMINEIALILIL